MDKKPRKTGSDSALAQLRSERGMTQRELAHAMSISTNALNRKINGASAFTVDEALKICNILSITDNHEKCNIFLN